MKERGRVYTPEIYAEEVLDAVNYEKNLIGKSVLENSCGIGDILKFIVRRYIMASMHEGYSMEEIRAGLERDLCGIEIDSNSVEDCKQVLSMVAREYGITNVKWNIICCDYLKTDLKRAFDYVIGNPPYLAYKDIDSSERKYIQRHFENCRTGNFDYYYAFIEKSINDLSEHGRMSYIVPYSLYKNEGAERLREYIKPFAEKVIDYKYGNKFEKIVTSSTILVLSKNKFQTLEYMDASDQKSIQINKERLSAKWVFSQMELKNGRFRFGDYFNVQNTIATLYNKAFVIENYQRKDGYYFIGDKLIEEEIVKPAISRKKGKKALDAAIIFPYRIENGVINRYSPAEMMEKFPKCMDYLMQFRTALDKRAINKSINWYEYGRCQALKVVLSPKLVIPSVESRRVITTIVDQDTIPLAGFFITVKDKNHTLEQAQRILEGEAFYDYLCMCGTSTTGYSRRISVKDIAAYTFDEWV